MTVLPSRLSVTLEQRPQHEAGSFVYGPTDMSVEQINSSTGAVLYSHHDQQGSTRLVTSSTGVKEASYTYDAYGNQTGHTGTATTPLGYDAQYTSTGRDERLGQTRAWQVTWGRARFETPRGRANSPPRLGPEPRPGPYRPCGLYHTGRYAGIEN